MKNDTIILIIAAAVAAFILFMVMREDRSKEGYRRRLGSGVALPNLNCYLKNQSGTPVSKSTSSDMGSTGAFNGIDVVTGIKLDSAADEGLISIMTADNNRFDFYAYAGQVTVIPYFPALGTPHWLKKHGTNQGISATVYGINLSGDVKRNVWASQWSYQFFNVNLFVKTGSIGLNMQDPHCNAIGPTGNVDCGTVC